MKRGVIVILGILVLALSPAVAPAQGFLGGALPPMPSMPSFGGFFGGGGGGSCDDPCPGPFSLFGTVAWNYQTIDLDASTQNFNFLILRGLKHTYRFNGVQLGVGAKAVSRTGFGALVSFDYLIVGSVKDTENYNEGFLVPGSRHWNTKNDTYTFDGMGFYNVYSTAALVGGFRWNHLETTFNNPSGAAGFGGLFGAAGDEAVMVANVYQPYVGVMVDQGGASRVLRIGMIGWPQLYGSVKYEQTLGAAGPGLRLDGLTARVNEGYFWEIFGEYGLREQAYMGAALSVFGKWTQYHVKGTFNIDATLVGGIPVGDDFWGISMHRNSWVAGVKLDIPLALPVPFSF
ncbi:MAG: hypothetical protein RDU20_13740 [Desulfomonilaceae bacterium]|nr:hypothetical protein [Desulfomonilaceae bacterium]